MSTQIPIPDLRFESSFHRSLQSKARQSIKTNSLKTNNEESDQDQLDPISITPGIILQVILKDVIIMPLIQGMIWTSILILTKPWLLYVAQNGRNYGVKLFKRMGFNLKKSTTSL